MATPTSLNTWMWSQLAGIGYKLYLVDYPLHQPDKTENILKRNLCLSCGQQTIETMVHKKLEFTQESHTT